MRTKTDTRKERLLAMQARLRAEIEELEAAIAGDGTDPGDLSHVATHPADHDVEESEADKAVDRNQVALLQAVEDALGRIAEGTYGRCAECGAAVAEDRLDAVPYAALCVGCQRRAERGGGA